MTKVETGSFTPNSTSVVVLLNDGTLNVKGVFFSVSPATTGSAEESSGFGDGVSHRSKSVLIDSTKHETYHSTTYDIMHWRDVSGTSTQKLAGYINSTANAGEIDMTFDHYDGLLTVDFTVIGD